MRWSGIATLALAQVAAVLAHPGDGFFKRAACNRDNCLRALNATPNPGLAKATADCVSFQTTTTADCYVTTITTTTVYANPSTAVSTTRTTSVESDVATVRTTSTSTSLTTTVTTTTGSAVSTATSTVVSTTVFGYNPNSNVAVGKRQANCGVPPPAKQLPTYASLCSVSSRYASACSCQGITATTVSQATITVIQTSTVTSTPIVSSTTTEISSSTTTYSTFTSVSTVVEPSIIVDVSSTTSTSTTTTTVVARPTDYITFAIQVGDNAGTYVAKSASANDNTAVFVNEALSSAPKFTLGANNELLLERTREGMVIGTGDFVPVTFQAIGTPPSNGVLLKCTVSKTVASNGGYPLTCTDGDRGDVAVQIGNGWWFATQSSQSSNPKPVIPQLYAIAPYNAPSTN